MRPTKLDLLPGSLPKSLLNPDLEEQDLIKLNLISSISTYIQLLALEEAILNANGLASFSPASL